MTLCDHLRLTTTLTKTVRVNQRPPSLTVAGW